jgi:hypothetical protein
MYQIELLGERPWFFAIIKLEIAVRRDAGGYQLCDRVEVSNNLH